MEGLAALAGGGADGDNLAGLLLDHVRDGEVDDGVDALEVDTDHIVPLLFSHLFDGGDLRGSRRRRWQRECPDGLAGRWCARQVFDYRRACRHRL